MKWQSFVRENRWTVFMTLSVVFLYSFLLFAGLFSKESRTTLLKAQKERTAASVELKQKEEVVKQRLLEHPGLMNALSLTFLLTLVTGLCLDIRFIRQRMQGRPWSKDPLSAVEACWGLRDVFQAFVLLFFVEGCLFLFQLFSYWATGLEVLPDMALLTNSLVRDVAITLFVLMLVRKRHGRPFSDLGLRTQRFFSFLRLGVVSYIAMSPLLVLTLVLLAVVTSLFSYDPAPQNVVQMYLKPASPYYLLAFTFFVAVLGPVMEEIFFRGFAYPALRKRLGIPAAAVFTAAVFAAFHMNIVAFVPIFVLGLFLTALYESSGSLIPSISAHVLHNTLMVLATLGFRTLSQ